MKNVRKEKWESQRNEQNYLKPWHSAKKEGGVKDKSTRIITNV